MSTRNKAGFVERIKGLFAPLLVQEPITVKCDYCGLYHQAGQICPQQTMVEAIKSGRIPKILPVPALTDKTNP